MNKEYLGHYFERKIDVYTFRFQSFIYLESPKTIFINKTYACKVCNLMSFFTINDTGFYEINNVDYKKIDISCNEMIIKKLLE